MKVSSRHLLGCSLFMALWLGCSGLALADVRLLVGFTGGEFSLEKVIRTSAADRTSRSANRSQKKGFRQPDNLTSAYVVWFDRSGQELIRKPLRDPRLIHAPIDNDAMETNLEYIRQSQGVFFLVGPNDARSVRLILPGIILPSNKGEALYLEQIDWRIDL